MEIRCIKTVQNYEELIKSIEPNETINLCIKFEEFNLSTIDYIYNLHQKTNISILYPHVFELTLDNIEKLKQGVSYIKNKYNYDTFFDNTANTKDTWTVDKVINATMRIEGWVQEINNAKVDGRHLSPFEKYLYAYQIVTSFAYNEVDNPLEKMTSRSLIGILNSDKIVCVGYAHLLSEICTRVGISCTPQPMITNLKGEHNVSSNHENCNVEIHDYIYNIHGVYVADACCDSIDENKESYYNNAFVEFDDMKKMYGNRGFIAPKYLTKKFSDSLIETTNDLDIDKEKVKADQDKIFSFIKSHIMENVKYARSKYNITCNNSKKESLSIDSVLKPMIEKYYLTYVSLNTTNQAENLIDMISFNKDAIIHLASNLTDESIEEQIESTKTMFFWNHPVYAKFSPDILEWSILVDKPNKITKDMFLDALVNVYISKGMTKDKAELQAMHDLYTSTQMAKSQFKITNLTNNLFINEAYCEDNNAVV